MTQVSEVEDLMDLVARLAGYDPEVEEDRDGAPTGCPCHCNFCGGSADDWYGQKHDDDCPWVEAMQLLVPGWKPPSPGRNERCTDGQCPVDEPHTHADHDLMHQYAKAVEARVLFEEYERTGEHPRDPAFTKKDGTHPLCHVWLDGRQGYRESCAVEGCETLRDSYGHLCVNGEWNY